MLADDVGASFAARAAWSPGRRPRPLPVTCGRRDPLERALDHWEGRRRRLKFFGPEMFGEPAWDMLVFLYLRNAASGVDPLDLAKLSGVAESTARRWALYLEWKGLVDLRLHPERHTPNSVELTPEGRARLQGYFADDLGAPRQSSRRTGPPFLE